MANFNPDIILSHLVAHGEYRTELVGQNQDFTELRTLYRPSTSTNSYLYSYMWSISSKYGMNFWYIPSANICCVPHSSVPRFTDTHKDSIFKNAPSVVNGSRILLHQLVSRSKRTALFSQIFRNLMCYHHLPNLSMYPVCENLEIQYSSPSKASKSATSLPTVFSGLLPPKLVTLRLGFVYRR